MKKINVFFITLALVGSIFFGSVAKAQTVEPGVSNLQSAYTVLMRQYVSLLMQLLKQLQAQLADLQAKQAETRAIVDNLASSTPQIAATSTVLTPEPSYTGVSGGQAVNTPEVVAPAPIEPLPMPTQPVDNFDQYKPVIVLNASQLSGNVGDKITLSWSVSAQGATRFDCSGSGDWGGEKDAVGQQEIELTKQGVMSFTLYCKALPGNYANSATITVQVN